MRLQVSSYIWVSVFFLILLGYFVTVSSFDVQGSTDCSRQTSSPVDCPPSSSEKGTENDDDDSGNIEEQIPSVPTISIIQRARKSQIIVKSIVFRAKNQAIGLVDLMRSNEQFFHLVVHL